MVLDTDPSGPCCNGGVQLAMMGPLERASMEEEIVELERFVRRMNGDEEDEEEAEWYECADTITHTPPALTLRQQGYRHRFSKLKHKCR